MNVFLPSPIIRDRQGRLAKTLVLHEWLAKLDEELDEVKLAAMSDNVDFDYHDDTSFGNVAEELQDLITVATSMLYNYVGLDEQKRNELCAYVNEKNRKRGYFED